MAKTIHKPADVIGNRYHVVRFIGQGGMQEVYEARDEVLKRQVALKVPKNSSAEKRFKRSAELSARLNHHNVAKTLDYLLLPDESQYLIEELIPGDDLQTRIDAQYEYLDPYLAAHVFHHLAKGLAVSHHAGVFHRDLKPSNVMVSKEQSLQAIKITDFGIAKMAEGEFDEARRGGIESLGASKTVVGALPFMAPELIDKNREAGTPADVWAIAAMMYRLMSGDYPFGEGLAAVEKIMPVNYQKRPRKFSIPLQFQGLLSDLWDLIEACLVEDPGERPIADDLVQRCADLCYGTYSRRTGVITDFRSGVGATGRIAADDGEMIFFHQNSYYGSLPTVNQRVCFSAFPGGKMDRAYPVLPLRPVGPNRPRMPLLLQRKL